MRSSVPHLFRKGLVRLLQVGLVVAICGGVAVLQAATNKSPVLISDAGSTRAIALESITLKSEPFPLTSTVKFGPDTRTRIAIFAMNLELLAGESANAFTSDVQDSTGKRYPLTVEYSGQLPGFPGITMLIVRLADDLGDAGDVLLRINLHGMSSNRVRIAIGHVGGGPPDDAGAVPTPVSSVGDPSVPDPPLNPDSFINSPNDADTVRFLEQASWGPTTAEVARVKAMGFRAYLNEQFSLPSTGFPDLPFPLDDQNSACPVSIPGDPTYNQAVCNRDNFSMYPVQRTFFTNALYGSDQLRQRVVFALHQILVISGRDITRPSWMTAYLQALDRNAFGSFRTLLNDVTLNPGMGDYLDMRVSTRTNPNENFAREVLQLFSVGVNELNIDGTPKLDAQGLPIPTYTQTSVNEFTRLLTGWTFAPLIATGITNWRDPMVPRSAGTNHDVGAKTLLRGATVPACTGTNADCARSDLVAGLDNIFNHPNVGPFIGKQLIQHLVTSNPSPAYVERVARVFNNDCDALFPQGCSNTRGNLRSVVQAILLDPEARGDLKTNPDYGKLREPIQLITAVLRGCDAKSFDRTSTSDGVLANRSTTDFPNSMDQDLFRPITVFSYYQPDYTVPGTKILGPAFGILSTTTTLRRANFVNAIVYTGISASTPPGTDRPRGTSLDLSPLEALASDPDQVLNRLNTLFLHGTLSDAMGTSIRNAMNAIPTSDVSFARKRAQVAVYLTTTSSQFEVQR